MRRCGFTLLEVLVATAIAGLSITAGFRLIAMSYSTLERVEQERRMTEAASRIWLRFRTDPDTPSSGTDEDLSVQWEAREMSVPLASLGEDFEFRYRRVTIRDETGSEAYIYVSP